MLKNQCHYELMNLKQLGELEVLLIGDLRDVLEEEANEQNRKWLLAIVEVLARTIPREFYLREKGGYLRDVVDCCPEVDQEVQALLEEHQTLRDRLDQLRNKLQRLRPFRTQAAALKYELAEWMNKLEQHNQKEGKLVHCAYSQDMGVGD